MYRILPAFAFLLFAPAIAIAQLQPEPRNQSAQGGSTQQTLDQSLLAESIDELIADIKTNGDAKRGALTFYQPFMACSKCHVKSPDGFEAGPTLTGSLKLATNAHIVESILQPSKKISKGFETVTVATNKGKTISGIVHSSDDSQLVLKDLTRSELIRFNKDSMDEIVKSELSLMPAGQVNILTSRQQFLDLVKYLMAIRDGGEAKEKELRPAASLYASKPVPEYEKQIDHAGLLRDLNAKSFKRGEAIYNRLCINCHGDHDKPGSLPTSLRFATGKFKNGHDPYSMYRTITYGFGMMVPQTWMVPQQKYDVIHYIREAYLKKHNPEQFAKIDDAYLKRLPSGSSKGPAPVNIERWATMDYGPSLINTYEIGNDAHNFAYKAIATRLDSGPGGIANGQYWMAFDHDTLRAAAAWSGKGFIDWNGIHFNGRHAIHPRVAGQVQFENVGPGWANPETGDFADPRLVGRDGRKYGPLPREWAHYKGLYHYGDKSIVSYTVGTTNVLEMPGVETGDGFFPRFTRTFNIGERDRSMTLQVLQHKAGGIAKISSHGEWVSIEPNGGSQAVSRDFKFDGTTHLELRKTANAFDMESDFSIVARIKTKSDGSIFTKTKPDSDWVPNGKSLFVRGGRLTFDIGWVGAVNSRQKVNTGQWVDVGLTWTANTGTATLYVNGKPAGSKVLRPKGKAPGHTVAIGYTSANFPGKQTQFTGEIEQLKFANSVIAAEKFAEGQSKLPDDQFVAVFNLQKPADENAFFDKTGTHVATPVFGKKSKPTNGYLLVSGRDLPKNIKWDSKTDRNIRLTIPPGKEPLRFTVCYSSHESSERLADAQALVKRETPATPDLATFMQGGPPRWPQSVTTKKIVGDSSGPFAVDVLTRPKDNPWLALVRLSGFDFYPGGDKAAVCAWDGDVWTVEGLNAESKTLTWKRIASGLFQPLGVKIIEGKIHCTCRDQLVILHDLNGDGETDYYQSLNNDHQVTEHFHEFAMGLQTDDEGNFYYAKSARHAKTALVPHHGTLLKISRDGSRTDILATGFRAANGVCLNPDGSFIVTDQEGHWNPKNRINWVRPGGFYGNMFGYHEVSDSSDSAMDQPLCWITNAFDRSPAELLWVESKKWGPLNGQLLNLSYGYGKVYVVPHEEVNGQMQGGMVQLPIDQFPTGIMRGRFSSADGQLYTCGMFAWAGTQHQPGGFYRIRYTGKPVELPVKLTARRKHFEIKFSGEVDPKTATDPANYNVKIWDLKRAANYGSKHYNERPLKVVSAKVSDDHRTVVLEIPEIRPTWGMEVKWEITSATGKAVKGTLHNTIHNLRD